MLESVLDRLDCWSEGHWPPRDEPLAPAGVALQVAVSVARDQGSAPVVYLTDHQSESEAVLQILGWLSAIPIGRLLTGQLKADEWTELGVASAEVRQFPLWLRSTDDVSQSELAVREDAARSGISTCIVTDRQGRLGDDVAVTSGG